MIGSDDIAATIAAVQSQFARCVFTAMGDVDAHLNQPRFRWGLGPAGDEPVIVGFDVAEMDAEGRFEHVLGFLDRAPRMTARDLTAAPGTARPARHGTIALDLTDIPTVGLLPGIS